MRILQINAQYAKMGGAEVYLHQLLEALKARGHRVALFAGSASEDHATDELCVVKRPDFDAGALIADPAFCARFRAFAQAFRPELVHAHNLHTFPATFPRVLGELGVPVLLHPHEYGLLCPNAWCTWADGRECAGGAGAQCFEHGCEANYPYDARNVVVSRVRYLTSRAAASAVVAGSEHLAAKLAAHGFPDVRTLRYFAEPAKFGGLEALAELRRATPRAPDHVLYLGRLEPEKGVSVLLRAFVRVRAARPSAELHVVGGGSLRAALEEEARTLGLGQAARFHGPVPHTEVPRYLARATCQVLPSIWCENAAQSCYDCLMLGLPLVASRGAALPEVVREGVNGLLFAPRDPEDLARQLVRVLAEPELARTLSAGCETELARYDKRAHLETLEALYAELVRAGQRAPVHASASDAELEAALQALTTLLHRREQDYVALERDAVYQRGLVQELRDAANHPAPDGRLRTLVRRVLALVRPPRA